jgi:NAD(P)H-hydrate epimerase
MVSLELETITNWGISPLVMQEHAAMGALSMLPEGEPIHILVGPGNNGGDGLALARLAKLQGRAVSVWTISQDPRWDNNAGIQAALWEGLGGMYHYTDNPSEVISTFRGWVVDGLFGLGIRFPLDGIVKLWIEALNDVSIQIGNLKILALDVPSGLDPSSPDITDLAVRANCTACFGYLKICHGMRPARDYCGEVKVIPIPIHKEPDHNISLLCSPPILFSRRWNTNKRDCGHVGIRAGAMGMSGAAVMAALGALHMGAGLVTILPDANVRAEVAAQVPEAIVRSWHGQLPYDMDALLVGPGGVTEIPEWKGPLVLDASALWAGCGEQWMARPHTIITPHHGEFIRLFGGGLPRQTSDRLSFAREVATGPGILVLKGAQSIVAGGDDTGIWVNPTGHSGLSTGGAGDFLAGMIAAQMAQWKRQLDQKVISSNLKTLKLAVSSALWLHGAVADRLGQGPLMIRELGPGLGTLLRELCHSTISK